MTLRSLPPLLCAFSLALPATAFAQDATVVEPEATVPPEAVERGQTYTPEYFAQFGPRNALEMVSRIPGFQISGGGGGGRGLGQADQNVLVNGERLTSKSVSVADQLGRIPAGDVVRIEVVEGATLDIPGLSGRVANVVTSTTGGISGVFRYRAAFSDNGTAPEWFGGEISISGEDGPWSFSASLQNNNNRFGGPAETIFLGPFGEVLETGRAFRDGAYDYPQLRGTLTYRFGANTVASLRGYVGHTFFSEGEREARFLLDGAVLDRISTQTGSTPDYEIGADVTFPLGKGDLKLIGLEAYDAEQSISTLIDTPRGDGLATGRRFEQTGGDGERIARFEYSFPLWNAEWQWSGEAAFNRLDRESQLFGLSPDGDFIEVPFPGSTGGVRESRYESILSLTRQLASNLALQASLGAEQSTISTTGAQSNSRTFQRPKGSATLAWQPGSGFDLSFSIERTVGQLSFNDFLSSVSLDNDNQNAGNIELVPPQAWQAKVEMAKTLGAWGSTRLTVEQRWIEDFIDFIVLPNGGIARGNIDSARRIEIESDTTLRLDPLGITGARVDLRLELEVGELLDPVTGELRDFSGGRDREIDIDFRHDVPGTQWAYGGGYRYNRNRLSFRLNQIFAQFEGPDFVNLFIEHKDVFGLTVTADYRNLTGNDRRSVRSVFDGPRNTGPLLFQETRSQRIGTQVRLSVSGNF